MVTSSLGDVDHGSLDVVNESMLVCDEPRPGIAQSVPEGILPIPSCGLLAISLMWLLIQGCGIDSTVLDDADQVVRDLPTPTPTPQ